MQQVEVDGFATEPAQAALAGRRQTLAAGVVRVDLADQEDLFAASRDSRADHVFGAALGVHLGGIDQRHPQFDAFAQRRDLALAFSGLLADMPGTLADGGDLLAIDQRERFHAASPVVNGRGLMPRDHSCRSSRRGPPDRGK